MQVEYPYDTAPFVQLSIEGVFKTLVEAVVLVFIVMFLFLQNLRATLIPTLAIPVVLLGTFGVLALFGYSINTLTMFGMVLAIGLLVDDAIVVVEKCRARHGRGGFGAARGNHQVDGGKSAARSSASPRCFRPSSSRWLSFSGSVGVIYRQFSITIVTAMLLSVLVALVLTPALCATMLRKPKHHADKNAFFRWFNRSFERFHAGL